MIFDSWRIDNFFLHHGGGEALSLYLPLCLKEWVDCSPKFNRVYECLVFISEGRQGLLQRIIQIRVTDDR